MRAPYHAAWAICSTHLTLLKASPGAAIFGQDMLLDIPVIADWKKIGEHRQKLTDLNTARENEGRIENTCTERRYTPQSRVQQKDPWRITTVHTNGTITIQCGNKEERSNIRRVKPFEE
jgi:hypothetical protein